MKKQLLFGHLLTLCFGVVIYLFCRVPTLKIFTWMELIGINFRDFPVRKLTYEWGSKLPNWLLYSVPDGMWIFSYVTLILAIWKNCISRESIFWLIVIPLVAVISEFGQMARIIAGTFDITDIILYVPGFLLPIFIFNKEITLNKKL